MTFSTLQSSIFSLRPGADLGLRPYYIELPDNRKEDSVIFCYIFVALLLRFISGVLRQAPLVVNLALQRFPLEMLPFQRHVAVRAVLLGDAQRPGVQV